MLYYYQEEVWLMRGTETLPEVKHFLEIKDNDRLKDFLKYLYFVYSGKSPFKDMTIERRKIFVITQFVLFDTRVSDKSKLAAQIEQDDNFIDILRLYKNINHTDLEIQSMVYATQIGRYLVNLEVPNLDPDEAIKIAKAIKVFRAEKLEVDSLILQEADNEYYDGREHLYEIPEQHVTADKYPIGLK